MRRSSCPQDFGVGARNCQTDCRRAELRGLEVLEEDGSRRDFGAVRAHVGACTLWGEGGARRRRPGVAQQRLAAAHFLRRRD